MKTNIAISLALLLSLNTSAVLAEDTLEADLGGFETEELNSATDDDLAGFGEEVNKTNDDLAGFGAEENEPIESDTSTDSDSKPSMFRVSGNVAFKTSYGYIDHSVKAHLADTKDVDYSGFTQAQTSIYLQVDGKLSDNWKMRISGDAFYDAIYDIRTENNYNQDTLDAYQTQLRLDDTYIVGRLTNDIDLKLGRQIVVWGKSDSIRITDVINPIDNRLPAMTDIEDLRLPTTMAKLDYYLGQWNLSAMLIGESRIMQEAAPRSEFFAVDSIFVLPGGRSLPEPFPELVTPTSSLDDLQYAFAANGVFSGWDLSFYGAYVLDQKWHFEEPITPTTPVTSASKRVVTRVGMAGSALNVALGSWLLKSEVAYLSGIKYNNTTDAKDRLDALVGFDYMGIKDTVFSLEIANRHILEYETKMALQADFVDENEMQTALRLTRSFSNDTINTSALVSMFGDSWQNGGFTRIWVEYDVMDAVVANVGVVDYIGGDKPLMEANKDNDRIFADIRYSF